MPYLLDTNIFIAAMKGLPQVRVRLENTPVSAIVLSPVVLGELEHGVEKSQHQQKNRERLKRFTEGLQLVPLDAETSRQYGLIRAQLESRGAPIGNNDYWIAAQALALGATLVTNNLGEFARVPGLNIENWLAAT